LYLLWSQIHGVRKGEHILPKALGGVRTIKDVCNSCNNGVLSDLDRELSSASPVGIIAAKTLGRVIGSTWDVDHCGGNFLLEGIPNWAEESMMLWPQLIVTHAGSQLYGDYEEVLDVSYEGFQHLFTQNLLRVFSGWKRTCKGLFFERLRTAKDLPKHYQYPPRVFARRRIQNFADGMTFVVGYETNADKRLLLGTLDNWNSGSTFRKIQVTLGSELPAVRRYWDMGKLLRSLMKLGINLIHDTCEHTTVTPDSFKDAIRLVMGAIGLNKRHFQVSGFVWPSDLRTLHRSDSGHSFRLIHDANTWHVFSSFFGGRVCTAIQFPGPSRESWTTADISTPLASDERDVSEDWEIQRHWFLIPTRYHVEWADPSRIIPSVQLANAKSRIEVMSLDETNR
jgi:hypothetical protein